MRAIDASAPGKAVLSGEYAVLEGAPAVSVAVERRARVRIAPTGDPHHRVAWPGRGVEAAFRANGDIEWLDGARERFALLEHVWRVARPSFETGVSLVLDTREFFSKGGDLKLGLGSSAALAVALAAALAADRTGHAEVHRQADIAHRSFQDGRGSGVDVATSVSGGVIAYRMQGARVENLRWPEGLELAFLWSGRPADTGAKLARLSRARGGASPATLVDAAERAYARWTEGEAEAVLQSLCAYADALLTFSDACDLGIFDAGHRELHEEAASRGLLYKPCGAGGGDVGAVFARERAAVLEFARWAEEARGFEALSPFLPAGAPGVTRTVG